MSAGSSFPSGHSAHAVLYPFLAIVAARHARLRPARRNALLVGGFALALLVGLTRIYLHAHYLSDVIGGWALGAAGFATAAAVAMVVAHLRETPGPDVVAGGNPH